MATIQEILEKPLQNSLALSRELKIDVENRTVELSFSSEAPILHWFGYLILDHNPESCRLERINSGGSLLYAHNRNQKIGANQGARIDADRKGRAVVKFSQVGLGAEKFQDVQDGIETTVSFGFRVLELSPEVGNDGKQMEIDGELVYRSRDWEPFEFSLEPIPADYSIGIGRTLSEEKNSQSLKTIITPIIKRELEKTMSELNNNNTPVPTPAPATVTRPEAELAKEFVAYGEIYGQGELARDFFNDGKTMDDLKRKISEVRAEQAKIPQKPAVQLTGRELEGYSLSRGIMAIADKDNSFELEVSQELARKLGNHSGGFLLPISPEFIRRFAPQSLNRAGLDSLTDTKGEEVVFNQAGSFIDMLRNRAKVIMLGATVLSGLQGGPLELPRQTAAATVNETTENPADDNTESELTLDSVTLTPRSLMVTTKYSRQLLRQNTYSIDQIVLNDIIAQHALKVDRDAIHHATRGLYAASGVTGVAFGGAITNTKIVAMETAVNDLNGDIGNMAYLTTAKVRGAGKETVRFANTDKTIWTDDNTMNGYRAEASNQVSKVMNVSAATGGSGHGILFGVWSELFIAEWGSLEILADPFTLGGKAMVRILSFQMVDHNPRHGECFSKGTGLTVA